MNAEMLKKAGIDYERGVKRFQGRAHLMDKVLAKFLQDSTFARINAAYEANDMNGLFGCAHEFKGMCGNIALDSLFATASAMVEMLRAGGYTKTELDRAYQGLADQYWLAYNAISASLEENA